MRSSSMDSPSEAYIKVAVDGEAAIAAKAQSSTRNRALNRAAFKLGTIPGVTTDTAIGALMLSAGVNGYLREHGEKATRQVLESGFRSGQSNVRPIQSLPRPARRSNDAHQPEPAVLSAIKGAPADPSLPLRTASDPEGKPRLHNGGADGPLVRSGEKRRHIYRCDNHPVRIKVMNSGGGAVNWYRVRNNEGRSGWQARKPEGYREIPYLGGSDPFDREVAADDLYWPEGEKDVDSVIQLGAIAITFGGTGDGLPDGCERYFIDRSVVILADNDEGGRNHAEQKAALIHPVARSVRIVHFQSYPKRTTCQIG